MEAEMMEFEEDSGIDPDRIQRIKVDDWYDFMKKYSRQYENFLVLNHNDGGVWIVTQKNKPSECLWVYDGYIPMFEEGRYIGYGHFGEKREIVRERSGSGSAQKLIPGNYIAYVKVTGSRKKWKHTGV